MSKTEAFNVTDDTGAPSNSTALTAMRTLLMDCAGNEERAVEALKARATRVHDLRDSMLDLAARTLLRMLLSEERRAIIRSVNQQTPNNDVSNGRLRDHVQRSMYDYQLSNGLLLGDARHADLLAQAEEHARNKDANARRQHWFQLLAKKLEGQKQQPVRKAMSEDDIKAAARKAKVNL